MPGPVLIEPLMCCSTIASYSNTPELILDESVERVEEQCSYSCRPLGRLVRSLQKPLLSPGAPPEGAHGSRTGRAPPAGGLLEQLREDRDQKAFRLTRACA